MELVLQRVFHWKDIYVENDKFGKPYLCLSGGALRRMEEMTPDGMVYQIDLTITDEHPMAQAIVILTVLSEDE